jgi:hypothetical protein
MRAQSSLLPPEQKTSNGEMVAKTQKGLSFPNPRTSVGCVILYIVLIGGAYGLRLLITRLMPGQAAKHRAAEQNMMGWTELTLSQAEIRANPDGIWTWAYEYVEGPALLKIEVKDNPPGKAQEWQYAPGKKCTADGDRNPPTQARNCIFPDAPVGALIAKIGGSTAGLKDGKIYLVGRKALLSLDQNTSGPLFFTINTPVGGMQDNADALKVSVSISILPAGNASAGGAAAPPPASSSAPATPGTKAESAAGSVSDKPH